MNASEGGGEVRLEVDPRDAPRRPSERFGPRPLLWAVVPPGVWGSSDDRFTIEAPREGRQTYLLSSSDPGSAPLGFPSLEAAVAVANRLALEPPPVHNLPPEATASRPGEAMGR